MYEKKELEQTGYKKRPGEKSSLVWHGNMYFPWIHCTLVAEEVAELGPSHHSTQEGCWLRPCNKRQQMRRNGQDEARIPLIKEPWSERPGGALWTPITR